MGQFKPVSILDEYNAYKVGHKNCSSVRVLEGNKLHSLKVMICRHGYFCYPQGIMSNTE